MVKISHKHKLKWDYKGWKTTPYTQNDWNQTLITKINQISAQIHMISRIGGANVLRCNTKVLKILESTEYYSKESMMLSNRYRIIVDDLMLEDSVYVYTNKLSETPLLIPIDSKLEKNENKLFSSPLGEITTEVNGVVLVLDSSLPKKKVVKYRKRLVGKIIILNYES